MYYVYMYVCMYACMHLDLVRSVDDGGARGSSNSVLVGFSLRKHIFRFTKITIMCVLCTVYKFGMYVCMYVCMHWVYSKVNQSAESGDSGFQEVVLC